MCKASYVWALLVLLTSMGWAVERPVTRQGFLDPTQISLEELLKIEVVSLTKRPESRDVAMTGEITLRGRVLPIGGVKEKLLAAHRFGIDTIILPKDNEKDLPEVPEEVRNAMCINLVETIDEVLALALEEPGPTDSEAPDQSKTPPLWTTEQPAQSIPTS